MFLFYTPQEFDGTLLLVEDEMRHAIKTLRKRVGDELHSTNGRGKKYKSRIQEISKSEVKLEVLSQEELPTIKPSLHIAIALTKKPNRFEWFLEKATEIGIEKITPLLTSRTEKKSLNMKRSKKIVISAMKQSLRCYLPELSEATYLTDYLEVCKSETSQKLMAHYKPTNQQLKSALSIGLDASIVIGPEGDFTEDESQLVEQSGFQSVNLGNFRLRTETAGVVASHTFKLINNE